jgi:glycosyltransferase involved in cell wall biosynthesis
MARPATNRSTAPDAPLVVAGLFSTANGIGEAARATYRALERAGLSPIAVDLSQPLAPVDVQCGVSCQAMPESERGTLILQLNGPETLAGLQHLGMRRDRDWYTIGYWAWELPVFPRNWHRAFTFYSELWTISEFTGSAINSHSKTPDLHVIPHAISVPSDVRAIRDRLRWPENAFIFLTMADGMSSLTRKNPFATIRAFKTAFGNDPQHRLIIKTRNLDHKPEAKADLLETIGDAENIEILDESLSEDDRWALLNSVDCFVSLHRSEGFGLVLAEAMALGKPVICTNWSGNTDFTSEETAALVDYELVPCEDPYGIYTDTSAHWAEVDLADAVAKMTKIASDSSYREQIGAAAKRHIESWASAERIGKLMAERLASIPIAPTSKT